MGSGAGVLPQAAAPGPVLRWHASRVPLRWRPHPTLDLDISVPDWRFWTITVAHSSDPKGPAGEHVSLSEQAYYEIRERILKGEIALGAPLSRRKLAVELGMSLLPVAEALQSLERDGLIESRPRVGTRVCLPGPDEIRERYEIREALESQAARRYAEKAGARQ